VNLSVWSSVEALFDFVYRTAHTQVMVRRREWPSPHAFTFKSRHPHPGETGEPIDMEPERYCR
jgi:hypothetical protein